MTYETPFAPEPSQLSALGWSHTVIEANTQAVVRVTSRGVSVHDPLLGRFTPNLLTFEAAWQLADFLTVLVL